LDAIVHKNLSFSGVEYWRRSLCARPEIISSALELLIVLGRIIISVLMWGKIKKIQALRKLTAGVFTLTKIVYTYKQYCRYLG
jgi:hypothetical protein